MHKDKAIFDKRIKRYKKVVIWGMRTGEDSFRYIQDHFFTTLTKLGAEVIWVDDLEQNNDLIKKNDLVWSANVTGKNLKLKKNVSYCLHNYDRDFYEKLDKERVLVVQVYTNDAMKGTVKWDAVTRFDKKNQVLYQPWGTNLLPWEFKEPVFSKASPFVFWVGSIWDNDQHQGNLEDIIKIKAALRKHSILFIHPKHRYAPDLIAWKLIQWSRIAPSIASKWQVKVNYLPCRMFKNISYGQLGITNVEKFEDLLGPSFVKGKSIEALIEKALSIPEKKYIDITLQQQEIIKSQTYLQKLNNILRGFEEIA